MTKLYRVTCTISDESYKVLEEASAHILLMFFSCEFKERYGTSHKHSCFVTEESKVDIMHKLEDSLLEYGIKDYTISYSTVLEFKTKA